MKKLLQTACLCLSISFVSAQNWKTATNEWKYDFQGVRSIDLDVAAGNDIQIQLPATTPFGGTYTSTDAVPGWLPAPATDEMAELRIYTTTQENAQYTLKRVDDAGLKVNSMDILLSRSANNNKFILRDMTGATGVAKFSVRFKTHYTKGSTALVSNDHNIWFVFGTNAASGYFQGVNTMQYTAAATQNSSVFAAFSFNYIKDKNYFGLAVKKPSDGTKIADNSGSNPGIGTSIKINGGDYLMDVYCNNSNTSQTYILGGEDKTIASKTFHIVIDGIFIGTYTGAFSNVDTDAPLNAFTMEAKNVGVIGATTNQGASVELMKDIKASYLQYTPLPVSLAAFIGNFNGNTIKLNWKTLSEKDNSHFEVLRSGDGITFNEIARVSGAGDSNDVLNYSATDYSPLPAVNYYQLKQVDNSGEYKLSEIIAVNTSLADKTLTVVNKGNGVFGVSLYSSKVSNINVYVTDVNGRSLYSQKVSVSAGKNQFDLDIPFLTSGIYILSIEGNDSVEQVKFVK